MATGESVVIGVGGLLLLLNLCVTQGSCSTSTPCPLGGEKERAYQALTSPLMVRPSISTVKDLRTAFESRGNL